MKIKNTFKGWFLYLKTFCGFNCQFWSLKFLSISIVTRYNSIYFNMIQVRIMLFLTHLKIRFLGVKFA